MTKDDVFRRLAPLFHNPTLRITFPQIGCTEVSANGEPLDPTSRALADAIRRLREDWPVGSLLTIRINGATWHDQRTGPMVGRGYHTLDIGIIERLWPGCIFKSLDVDVAGEQPIFRLWVHHDDAREKIWLSRIWGNIVGNLPSGTLVNLSVSVPGARYNPHPDGRPTRCYGYVAPQQSLQAKPTPAPKTARQVREEWAKALLGPLAPRQVLGPRGERKGELWDKWVKRVLSSTERRHGQYSPVSSPSLLVECFLAENSLLDHYRGVR